MLPMLREHLRNRTNAAILDLGPPTKNKLAYFSNINCRYYSNNFPDSFYGRLTYSAPEGGFSEIDFRQMLPGWDSLEFDVILAWDCFDHLNREALKQFVTHLARRCRQHAFLHFLITQTSHMPKTPALIDLAAKDRILYVPGSETLPATRHPAKVLEELMPGFSIRKLCLLRNGLQEHLFTFSKDAFLEHTAS